MAGSTVQTDRSRSTILIPTDRPPWWRQNATRPRAYLIQCPALHSVLPEERRAKAACRLIASLFTYLNTVDCVYEGAAMRPLGKRLLVKLSRLSAGVSLEMALQSLGTSPGGQTATSLATCAA